MSPTSYQAAPPRTRTIADAGCGVKSRDPAAWTMTQKRLRASRVKRKKNYQVLYCVPSVEEMPLELEWTSTMPLFT